MRTITVAALIAVAAAAAAALSPFEEGEKLYAANEPLRARALLEEALKQDPGNPKIYAYLGVVYEQLGDAERAIAIMRRGLAVAGDLKSALYYNMGNNYVRRGEHLQAEKMYGEAIALDESFPEPWLNRANARVTLLSYEGAISDYTMYLRLAPQSRQRADVERMIDLLTAFLQKKEAAERERRERERALMEQVLNALRTASEDAQNLSAKSDKILEEKEEEIDIDQ